ncbi:MAG: glycosyltransferase [Synergistaceae bacterium]|nr:glycosyltransferase [Synergistaceae bacterium]
MKYAVKFIKLDKQQKGRHFMYRLCKEVSQKPTELMSFNSTAVRASTIRQDTDPIEDQYMVSIFCSTHNQRKYIRTCLDSLVNQKTSFKYEIIVKDDASTDGQQEIIKQYAENYPDKIMPLLLETNHFELGLDHVVAEKFLKISRGKYIAICEGDDFWTDENKLQIQVDFMETHPECSLCGHAAYYANEDGTLRHDKYFRHIDESRYLSTEELIEKWMLATNSVMFRKSVKMGAVTIPYQEKCIYGDYATLIYFSLKGKVYFLNKLMSAYRVLSLGSLSQTSRGNANLAKERILELVNMLDRIDAYTSGKYSTSVNKFKNELLFLLYLSLNDSEELRKYSHLWHNYGVKVAINYILCVYFNGFYTAPSSLGVG